MVKSLRAELDESGVAVVDPGLEPAAVEALLRAIRPLEGSLQSSGRAGARDILRRAPEVRRILAHPRIVGVVRDALGPGAFAVKGILFDKRPAANWKVPWHQDLTIAVESPAEVSGYGPWSVKAGVTHVQPPIRVLEEMVAIRIHLDACTASSGALRILAGSHRHGEITGKSIVAARELYPERVCPIGRGGLLVMRPLLLHASSAAEKGARRRVLHLEFSAGGLAPQIRWFEHWPCAA